MFRQDLLKSKRVLITGGGTGLGRAIAERFLQLGATVYICGRRADVRHPSSDIAFYRTRLLSNHLSWYQNLKLYPASTK